MTYPISYGSIPESDFLDAGESIVRDFENLNSDQIISNINQAFFGGDNFAPKSLTDLMSIKIPSQGFMRQYINGSSYVVLERDISFSAIWGFLETIPVIGSALAAINVIAYLFLSCSARSTLRHAVWELRNTERSAFNIDRGASTNRTKRVIDAAVDLTIYHNHLTNSLLSIVPFLKPTIRTAQCLAYYCCPRALTQRV